MKLPSLSGAELIKALRTAGWVEKQRREGHAVLVKAGGAVVLTVPLQKTLAPLLLRRLARQAGIDVQAFADSLA
ncbi:MAG: type II toxin-antitoxin system HicA family toxin [Gemmataceae bacterium]|nr:type II toxin-antitoxin system HicA family toxin [Gemmataceae bacterium]